MADSIEGIVPIPLAMPDSIYDSCNYPWVAKRRVNNRDEVKPAYQDTITARAFGGAGFRISGKWLNDDPGTRRLAGYWLSMNVPTCTLGNNVVLTNGVPRACELAVMYLKIWALEQGCTAAGVNALDFERMKLTAVTPTFLHELGSRTAALQANYDVRLAMELRNRETSGKQSSPAFGVGPSYDATAYLHGRTYDISGYVKDRYRQTEQVFETEDLRLSIYDEGETKLRLETLLKGAWLKERQLDRPEEWRLYGGDGPYPKVYGLIRKALRVDEDLRNDEPSDQELGQRDGTDKEIVRFHLAGGNAALHPLVVGNRNLLQQQKYLSDLKARTLKYLRIDLSVPWARQRAAKLGRLRPLLQYPGLYVPPTHLEDGVFSQQSVARVALELQQRMAKLMPRTLGNIVLDLRTVDPPPVKLGRLTVSEAARRCLDKYRVPLHQLLRCHELGIFGEVTLEEVAKLIEAAAKGEAVTSRFPVFDRVILITTDPKGVEGPTTAVTRADEMVNAPESST